MRDKERNKKETRRGTEKIKIEIGPYQFQMVIIFDRKF
jgi:hypothetical protein